jgi:hypothetical protein
MRLTHIAIWGSWSWFTSPLIEKGPVNDYLPRGYTNPWSRYAFLDVLYSLEYPMQW